MPHFLQQEKSKKQNFTNTTQRSLPGVVVNGNVVIGVGAVG